MEERIYNPQFFEKDFLRGKSGIYQIRNLLNNKIYIGSTKDLERRCRFHFNALNRGKHENKYLQRAYNKQGKDNFIFEVIEFCNPEIRFEIEQYWINKYIGNVICYNLNEKASCPPIRTKEQGNSPIFTKEQREYLSNVKKKYYQDHPEIRQLQSQQRKGKNKGKDNVISRPVVCLETKERYSCITEAGEKTNINPKGIQACCSKKNLSAGGYHWVYEEQYKILNDIDIQNIINQKQEYFCKEVICLETNKIYSSCSEVAKDFNCGIGSVSSVCRGKLKSLKGYRFVYKEDYDRLSKEDINIRLQSNIKKFKQECVHLETKKTYKSLIDAERDTGISHKNIQACCCHKQKSINGHHWLYKTEYDTLTEVDINNIIDYKRKCNGFRCKCIETGKIYHSCLQAAKELNLCDKQIRNSCRGLKAYTHGYHFQFVD